MIYATNGATIFIGGIMANDGHVEEAAFVGKTWVECKCLENLGTLGDTASELNFESINCDNGNGRMYRAKGVRNAGTMELIFALDLANAGQAALMAAEANDQDDYAFRVVLNDAPQGGSPSERLFAAKVGGVQEVYDAANNVMKLQVSLWVNSNIVRKPRATAP